jgi:general secretion pathway protein G
MRETIDKFYADTGRYPQSLEELVEKKYLRMLPVDPVTDSTMTWIVVPPDDGSKGNVYDVRSGASGTIKGRTPYSEL